MVNKYVGAVQGGVKLAKYIAKKFTKTDKGGVEVISGVAPKVTKGESPAVKLHKLKMSIKKGTDDVSDAVTTGKNKIIKSLEKMK